MKPANTHDVLDETALDTVIRNSMEGEASPDGDGYEEACADIAAYLRAISSSLGVEVLVRCGRTPVEAIQAVLTELATEIERGTFASDEEPTTRMLPTRMRR